MHRYTGKLIRSLLLIGLVWSAQVPAIDGDYGNPYANDTGPVEWDGSASYGGLDAGIPLITYFGGGLLVVGVLVGIGSRLRGKKTDRQDLESHV